MDAKPHRPRILRVHDENIVPSHMIAANQMKSLGHIRTKSTPALPTLIQAGALRANANANAGPRVLGEINTNLRVATKDDSEVGKISPGKLKTQKDLAKQSATAAFARPAARPLLSVKNTSGQVPATTNNTSTATAQSRSQQKPLTHAPEAQLDQAKRLTAKKSTKILREIQQAPVVAPAAVINTHANSVALGLRSQEVHSTAVVVSRDAHAAAPQTSRTTAAPPGLSTTSAVVESMALIQPSVVQPSVQSVPRGIAAHVSAPYEIDEIEDLNESDGYTTARSWGLAGDLTNGHTTVIVPRCTDKVRVELEAAKAHVIATRPIEDIEDEHWDTSMVAEYGDEIFGYMRELEVRMAPNPFYMDQQTEIQWSMRGVLVDWVIQVHQRFNLLPETLFLTINYIDRFLSCKIVSLGKLQLVGATAIFIAAKYEEVNCPTLSEIIYMVDNGYAADELLKAERFMLSMLQFELGWPGPMSFLRRISKADDYDLETRTLAKYFLEVTIMDERFIGCTPSYLAAGAHCMARLLLRKGDWSPAHVYYSNYTLSQLHRLLKALLDCCQAAKNHHRTVYEKYTDRRYKKASIFVREQLAAGFQLPIVARGSSVGPQSLWQ